MYQQGGSGEKREPKIMDINALIFQVALLFIMMVPGVVLKKANLVPDGFGKGLANLILYIAQPILIVAAYINCEANFADIWLNIVIVFLLSIVAHVLFSVVALLLFRGAVDSRRRMLRFATIFANAAFMGIPLIDALIGPEAAIYASIYNITFNLFLWTLGVHLCTVKECEDLDGDGDCDIADRHISARRETKKAKSLLKVLLHPVTLASIIGVICLIAGVNAGLLSSLGLDIITSSLNMIKALVAPLSMVVIGLRLAEIKLKGIFTDGYMYLFLALRHLALPLVLLGIIKLVGLIVPINEICTLVTIILACTPAASSATMFAEKYDCDAVYTSRLVVVSTILCIITMPLVVSLALI